MAEADFYGGPRISSYKRKNKNKNKNVHSILIWKSIYKSIFK